MPIGPRARYCRFLAEKFRQDCLLLGSKQAVNALATILGDTNLSQREDRFLLEEFLAGRATFPEVAQSLCAPGRTGEA